MTATPVLQAYIVSTIVLGLNLLVLASNTAVTRSKAGEVVNPEDKKLNESAEVVYEDGNATTARYRRAHRNALENIPMFVITGFLLTLTPISLPFAAGLFGAFTLLSVAHSFCYVKGVQPLRTATFGLAAITQLVVLGYLGYAAFGA